ncbi:DinB family protein [Agaribacterium sp. ZY112]|uniref:DinB family protein n=1 Tax=Agaribacterium sp. ZY112 TaxID=3233574 RepID=UPI003524A2F9
MKSQLSMLANYNLRMNKQVYTCIEGLSSESFIEDRGLYFGSICGTLNHLLVGDILWLKRFASHPSTFAALDYVRRLEKPTALDAVIYTDFKALKAVRIRMDAMLCEFIQSLNETDLKGSLSYKNTKGDSFCKSMAALLLHLFNHQTHHRGQITTVLNQLGFDYGVTDLLLEIPDR